MKFISGGYIKTDDLDDYVYVNNALIQRLEEPLIETEFRYDVGLVILPNYGSLVILSPGLAVPLNDAILKKLEDTQIFDSSPMITSIPGVYD